MKNNTDEYSAGAILYTIIDKQIYYLLIKDFHYNWGFPKGHLENNETTIEAAYREIKEEVNIKPTIDDSFCEELIYKLPNGINKHSIYFLAYYENQEAKKQIEEVQEIKLLKYEDALNTLTFDNMKQVLIKANKYLCTNLTNL